MRGKLIDPFLAEISQLDTVATAADPDDTGPLESGYDEDFREAVRVSTPSGGRGTLATKYKDPLRLRVQVEIGTMNKVQQFFSGNSPDNRLVLIAHFKELERAGFVDLNGMAGVRIGDRLDGIYEMTGRLVQLIIPPVYVVQAEPASFGLGLKRNLLAIYFEARTQAPTV